MSQSLPIRFANRLQDLIESFRALDFLTPTAIRLYLAPVFIMAGAGKLDFSGAIPVPKAEVVQWFGNPDWGLGLPFPELMVFLAAYTEFFGGIALVIGLAVRWLSVPLMATMLVAALTAHWDNGWFAIAPGNPDTSAAKAAAYVGFPGAQESLQNSEEVAKRAAAAKRILQQHGNYNWLTEKGNFVILNNGIEFAVTYFLMLSVLFFMGAGRFLSLDYYIRLFLRDRE